MSFYCLCERKNDKPDSQAFMAPNRYCAMENELGERPNNQDFPPLSLMKPMKCIAVGVQQVLGRDEPIGPNNWSGTGRPQRWRKHYPNVDVFECTNCGARMAR